MKLLEKIKIIDLSHRLPGPLGGKILADLGANVIKIEDENFKDPFLSGLFNDSDDHFINWYNQLNGAKSIVRFDFKSDDAKIKMDNLLKDANALILAQPAKIMSFLGISKESLESKFPKLCVIELKAGEGKFKNLHDLNALALSGLLDMHLTSSSDQVIAPPFLPVAGISFGHWVATKLLATMVSGKKWEVATLEEAAQLILKPFKSSSSGAPRYLHNGKFPCYCLYRTFDGGALAVAAVEDKFWKSFTEVFELDLTMENRFDTSEATFKYIASKISLLNKKQIKEALDERDICVTLV